MTTPEHTLVGVHLALALGWHRSLGWPAVVLAGVASNVPDWDGLPMLVNMARFEAGHRVWGHNLVAIVGAAFLLAWSQSRFRWCEPIAAWLGRFARSTGAATTDAPTATMASPGATTVAFLAQLVHLPCDLVVSGGAGLADWPIRPLWPFSSRAFVAPLIPWGDVGPTLILIAGAIVAAKAPARLTAISSATLVGLVVYLFVRGWASGTLVSG